MATSTLGEVKLLDVRLSFFHGFDKSPDKTNKKTGEVIAGSFQLNALIDPTTETGKANMAKMKAATRQLKVEKWGDDEKKWPKIKPEKLFLRDGSLENYDGYEGMYYASMRSNEQPVLIDRVKDGKGKWVELTKENGGPKKLYSGAFGNVICRIWIQDNEHGIRINCEVKAVQFVRHGEAFSSAAPVDPNEAFGDDDVGEDDLDVGGFDGDEEDGGLI